MKSLLKLDRRRFLSAMGLASLAQPSSLFSLESITDEQTNSNPSNRSAYMLAPGLTYLNTGSVGPTSRKVLDRTLQAWNELETNPVRMVYGHNGVLDETDHVRERAAAFLGCATEELLITRSTTDGMNNLALGSPLKRGDRILTTDQEHEGGSVCWKYLARRQGIMIERIAIAPSDHDPNAIVQRFAKAITPETKVISVCHVSFSTGLRMPVAEIAALARQRGIYCVVDGAQAAGEIPVNVKSLGCHAYATSGHKWLLGPKGTGLLYVSRDSSDFFQPIQREEGNRCVEGSTGVSSLPLIVGLGTAIESLQGLGMPAVESRVVALRNRAYAGLIDLKKIEVVSVPPGPLATALVSFRLPDEIDGRKFQTLLHEKYNVTTKVIEKPSFNGIRLSPHIFNTEADVDKAVQAIRTELG